MPPRSPVSKAPDDLMRRLDEVSMPNHERELAKSQMRIAFHLVDAAFEAVQALRVAFFALWRRVTPRERVRA